MIVAALAGSLAFVEVERLGHPSSPRTRHDAVALFIPFHKDGTPLEREVVVGLRARVRYVYTPTLSLDVWAQYAKGVVRAPETVVRKWLVRTAGDPSHALPQPGQSLPGIREPGE